MRKTRLKIVTTKCRRGCGRTIAIGSRSLFGADDLKAKYGSICESCMTPEEQSEMMLALGERICGLPREMPS